MQNRPVLLRAENKVQMIWWHVQAYGIMIIADMNGTVSLQQIVSISYQR